MKNWKEDVLIPVILSAATTILLHAAVRWLLG